MKKYLSYIKNKYSIFRYKSDENILQNLNIFKNIKYKIISNDIWFCLIFRDFRISNNIYFFWFLEIYNFDFSKKFLEQIKQEVKIENKKTKLVWPINISIWNSYRFWNFEKNNKIIFWEYETDYRLNELLLKNNFSIYEKYLTAERIWCNPYKFNKIDNFFLEDLEIINFKPDEENLKNLYNLSKKIFLKASIINFIEFQKFMNVYLELYKNNIWEYFLVYKWKNIWFLSSFYDKDYFVIKTMWILKKFRWKWLWNYFLSYIYNIYLKKWFKKSYYLYMRENWDALKMQNKNARKYREYFTYYINI